MSPTRTMQFTTSTHALVIAVYAALAVLGIEHVLDITTHKTVDDWVGVTGGAVWSLLHVLGGLGALTGALVSRREKIPVIGPFAEGFGVAVLVLALGFYEIALLRGGWDNALTTQTYTVALGIGCLARLAQLLWEQHRLSRAIQGDTDRPAR